jgi:hypothetical protein
VRVILPLTLGIFLNSPCDDSLNSSDKNGDSEDSDCPFKDKVDYLPEYYLVEAENLDVSKLRQ